MCIWWSPSLQRLWVFFVDRKYTRNKRFKGVKHGVICFESSSLKPPGQLEPNLVVMFNGWSFRKWWVSLFQKIQEAKICLFLIFFSEIESSCKQYMFCVDRKHTNEPRGLHVSKGWCLFWIFFSETTGPIGTNLGRNIHWMVLWKVCFIADSSQNFQETQRCQKGCCLVRLFYNQSSWFFFFIVLIKLS